MLSVVIPIHNEEPALLPLYDRLTRVMEAIRRPYEVLFVDDASTDRSFELLANLAETDPDKLAEVFARRPALHRFPKAMADRVRAACQLIVDDYDGDPAAVWTGASTGAELLGRVTALPGFGPAKAQIFVALLGKQFDVQPPGWREAAGGFGAEGSFVSVADIVDADSLAKVREHKKQMKAAARAAAEEAD